MAAAKAINNPHLHRNQLFLISIGVQRDWALNSPIPQVAQVFSVWSSWCLLIKKKAQYNNFSIFLEEV